MITFICIYRKTSQAELLQLGGDAVPEWGQMPFRLWVVKAGPGAGKYTDLIL